jgi:hypothetical protein
MKGAEAFLPDLSPGMKRVECERRSHSTLFIPGERSGKKNRELADEPDLCFF